jgi:NAD(P)-dependent dehydrogenase (short-subunit alcohol dehydrogenase family)
MTDPEAAMPRLERLAPAQLFSLRDRTVVITGASSGMGESLAIGVAAAGARVFAVARRIDRLEALASETPLIEPIAADLGEREDRCRLIDAVLAHGPVDVLVNTAGTVGEVVAAENEQADEIERVLGLNLVAPFHLAQGFGPAMRANGGGAIVNIASISGVVGIGRIPQASYVASKTGLVGLTRELAAQWGRWNIRVNAVAAGYFRSDMTADMFASEKMVAWLKPRQPLPRTGMPEDFVGTVLLLASDAGRFITGQTFAVDGGWTAV